MAHALVTEGTVMFSGHFLRPASSSYLDFCPATEKAFQNFELFMLITKLSETAAWDKQAVHRDHVFCSSLKTKLLILPFNSFAFPSFVNALQNFL